MKKSIFLFFAAILCAIGMNAANLTGGTVLYLKPSSNWQEANAWFAMYLCNGSSSAEWVKMTKSGDYYMATVPVGTSHNNVIFCRMNPASTTLDWSNKWTQTGDLEFDAIKNCYTTSGWDNGSWSTYKPESNASLTSSAANIFVGGQATLTAKLSSNTNVNTLKSTSYAISPNTGASISGNTFTATAEGTYTVTATVTYYPNGCTSLASGLKTATATTTITAEVPAEETHDVTVSYICGETKLQDPTTVNTVGVETESEVTAPAKIKGYTFVNWTIGSGVINTTGNNNTNIINILTKSTGDYTLTANYEPETVYFVNTDEWENVGAYAWTKVGSTETKNAAWPGVALTATGEKIGGYDVYSYTLGDGFENVIFTNINGTSAKNQTPDLKWVAGKYYVYNGQGNTDADDWYTKEDVEEALPDWLATNVYLVGNMFANWDKTPDKEFRKTTKDATTASILVALDANKDYELKVRRGDDWTSCTSKITNTVSNLQFSSSNNDNCKMKTTVAGDYTFTWTISSSKLAVTYPTICAITATANDAAMGTIAGAGEYGKGSTATLTATPNDGYLFVNWTKGSEEVSTDATYSFKVEEAVALVANFEATPEDVHNVTVSYVCGDNKIAEDQIVASVGETTPKTAEAPAIFGYTFSSWTLGEDVTSTDELTSNTIDINIVASGSDYTLTANYTEIPKIKVYAVNNKKWSKINVYGWKEGEAQGTPAWPGQEITANIESEKVAGFDVYSYSVVPGSYDYLILNDGSGDKTENYKWTDGKYYYVGAAENYAGGTAEEVATVLESIVTYDYYIAEDGKLSGKTDWSSKSIGLTDDDSDGIYEKTFTEQAVGTYLMKVTNGTWNDDNVWGFSDIEGAYEEVKAATSNNNIQITLTVATTFTVKFNSTTKKITFEGLTEKAPEPTFDYYITGSFNGDNPKKAENGMTLDGTVYKATVTLAAGDNTLKVTKGSWDPTWGYNELGAAYEEVSDAGEYNNIKITLAAEKSITVIFDATAGKITFEGLSEVETETLVYYVEVPEGTEDCYIAGEMNDWDFVRMTQVDATHWTITYDNVLETTEYKYACQASWDYKELDKEGNDVANRTWTANDVVEKWNNPYTEVRTELTAGNYYTICMNKEMQEIQGATLWSFCGKDANFAYLVQENAPYTAGKAYIMYAEAETVSAILTGEKVDAPVADADDAIRGTFVLMEQDALDDAATAAGSDIYLVIGNQLRRVNGQADNKLPANRAYVVIDKITGDVPAGIPANRVRSMPMQPQVATGMENVDASAQPVKTIINGQLYILRGEKMYDAQGKLVK